MRDSKVEQNWTLNYSFEERKKKKRVDTKYEQCNNNLRQKQPSLVPLSRVGYMDQTTP